MSLRRAILWTGVALAVDALRRSARWARRVDELVALPSTLRGWWKLVSE